MQNEEVYVVRSLYNPDDIEVCMTRSALVEYMTKVTGEEWKESSLNYHFSWKVKQKGGSVDEGIKYKGWKVYKRPARRSQKMLGYAKERKGKKRPGKKDKDF